MIQLFDGKRTRWDRADILGIADESKLPLWASERLKAIREKELERRAAPPGKRKGENEIYR